MKNTTMFLISFICLSHQMIMPAMTVVINSKDSSSNANEMLLDAMRNNNIDLAISAIEAGADVNAVTHLGWTPLMMAAELGYADIVNILIKNNADLNATDNAGYTALMMAIHKKNINIVRILVENKADLNITNNYQLTALITAAQRRCTKTARILLAAGANPDISNINGRTARLINPAIIDEAILANRNTIKELQALPPFVSEIRPNVEMTSMINAMLNPDPYILQNLNKIKDWPTNEEFETNRIMKLLQSQQKKDYKTSFFKWIQTQ